MLTKSDLQSYLQCPRKLWLEHNNPQQLDSKGAVLSRRVMDGIIVGEKAREQLGSDYIWPRSDGEDKNAVAEHAKAEILALGTKPAAEVPMVNQDLYARADALLVRGSGYVLRETKAATFPLKRDKQTVDLPEKHHLDDVAIQRWVMEGWGVGVAGVELNLLDKTWRYSGGNEYIGLFRQLDVTEESDRLKVNVPAWLQGARDTLKGSMPTVTTGKHCSEPYECAFRSFCDKLDPPKEEHPIELLPGIAGQALAKKLREAKGYRSILDLSLDDLAGKNSSLYTRMQSAHRTGEAILDAAGAADLRALPYPRYFFDFEGIDFPVPQWKGFRPYEHAPFQWSCHIETIAGEFQHAEFLDLSGNDPSVACLEELRQVLNPYDVGPIIVYNATYERQRLEELAVRHPEYGELVDKYISRLFDLLPVVRDCFYHPAMRGSFSIKAVLPAVAPDLNYGELEEVQEGTAAQLAYLLATKDPLTTTERKVDLERKLRIYCRQDTWAMVEIAHFLLGYPRPRRPDLT